MVAALLALKKIDLYSNKFEHEHVQKEYGTDLLEHLEAFNA